LGQDDNPTGSVGEPFKHVALLLTARQDHWLNRRAGL
jgi:hypothetical protein